jgi:hypothetical protein
MSGTAQQSGPADHGFCRGPVGGEQARLSASSESPHVPPSELGGAAGAGSKMTIRVSPAGLESTSRSELATYGTAGTVTRGPSSTGSSPVSNAAPGRRSTRGERSRNASALSRKLMRGVR